MINYAHELFLLSTNLSQYKNKNLIIKLFVECINSIFLEHNFSWNKQSNVNEERIEVCTKTKTFGYINFSNKNLFTEETFSLLQNAVQLLGIILEKLETEESLNYQKEYLNILVAEQTKELVESQNELRKQKEEIEHRNKELTEKNFFIQTILDNLPIGLALNDIDKNESTYVNKKFEEIYGWKKEELQTITTFFEKIYPNEEYRTQIVNKIVSDIQSGDKNRMHWENIQITTSDGSQKRINAVNIPLFEQHTMVSTVMDMTELYSTQQNLQKAKEKAEESDALKTAFLQNISHEIRTPLNAISGFAGLLNDPDTSEEKRNSFITIIQNSSNQLISIVSDILTISALQTNQEKVVISKTCINEILLELLTIFKSPFSNHNISLYLKQKLSDNQSTIYTDKTKLTQILTNLLSNALKFTHNGTVEFGYTLLSNSEIRFYVQDTGIGINSELHQVIFERFRQADKSIQTNYGGNGLGLSISKAFTELLGGKIWVESSINEGSTFYFTIPYKPVNETILTETTLKKINTNRTILVAEDEEFNFLLLEELLSGLNVEIIHAKNGKECLDFFNMHSNITLIIMDIKMPIMNGNVAAKQIKEIKPDIPIIAQSAYALEHEIAQFKGIFDQYIVKPIKRTDFLTKVNLYLD